MTDTAKRIAMRDAPLGYQAAEGDWNEIFAGRTMQESDWNSLTIGEQQRYAEQECKTKGAVYQTRISAKCIKVSVNLPASLALHNLTEREAEKVERYIHHALEREIAAILKLRQLCGGFLP